LKRLPYKREAQNPQQIMECPTPKRTMEEEGEDNKENPNHNISNSFSIFLDETLLNTYL